MESTAYAKPPLAPPPLSRAAERSPSPLLRNREVLKVAAFDPFLPLGPSDTGDATAGDKPDARPFAETATRLARVRWGSGNHRHRCTHRPRRTAACPGASMGHGRARFSQG